MITTHHGNVRQDKTNVFAQQADVTASQHKVIAWKTKKAAQKFFWA